jgi:Bacteriophage HK97-gp10, putative tail-component
MAKLGMNNYQISFEMEGADKLAQMFNELPDNFSNKVMRTILRKGAAIINGEIKKATPSCIKGVDMALDMANLGGAETPTIVTGFFRNKRYFSNKVGKKRKKDLASKDVKFDAATIAYWFNYGTMANRSGQYQFATPRKGPRKNAAGGIRPTYFFQEGVVNGFKKANESVTKDFDDIFSKAFAKLP